MIDELDGTSIQKSPESRGTSGDRSRRGVLSSRECPLECDSAALGRPQRVSD